MHYLNAAAVLPRHLLRAVQSYAGGELLYIPAPGGTKTQWGSLSGAQRRYTERNCEIRTRHMSGESVRALAESYCLTEDSIRKIIRRRAE